MSSVPDVSVIVPVYNTMPYLEQGLESLAQQTIGMGRLQVVLVDDGSTDGSAAEVDGFAARFPADTVVRHQSNSGGPANPCNEGLALATGRYVFFMGSDDYLATDAMERLVTRADEWGSDVIFGTMVGVNDRFVDQRMFQGDERDVDFVSHPLAYSLSQTKLFRRTLIDRLSLQFPEELTVGEDQLFVIKAMLEAGRVSVLSGTPVYYAVKRDDGSNITYTVPWRPRLEDVTAIMKGVADLAPEGELRDAILRRHFHFELGSLLKRDFPQVTEAEQIEIAAAYAALADSYLTERISERLSVEHRVRARLAQSGDLGRLRECAAFDEETTPTLLLRDGRAYSRWPGFDHHPSEWYRHNPKLLKDRISTNVAVTNLQLSGDSLLVEGSTLIDVDSSSKMYIALVKPDANSARFPARRLTTTTLKSRRRYPVEMNHPDNGGPSRWQVRVPFPIAAVDDGPITWEARLRVAVEEWTYDLPITFVGSPSRTRSRHDLSWQELSLEQTAEGYVTVHQEVVRKITAPTIGSWGKGRTKR